jgi:hypothetical protein
MNVEIGTEAAQFPEKEYINGIFVAVQRDQWPASSFLKVNIQPALFSPCLCGMETKQVFEN